MQRPDASGRFGKYGGKYVPETLITALAELEAVYAETKNDPSFKVCSWLQLIAKCCCIFLRTLTDPKYYDLQSEFAAILKDYVGRESPLYHADRLSEHYKK
jgi:tryptophan synthase beta chain